MRKEKKVTSNEKGKIIINILATGELERMRQS
jgi:hypothetical protein